MNITELGMLSIEIKKVSDKIIKTMNEMHDGGHSIEMVLLVTLYVVGGNIKRLGLPLELDSPLTTALPALVEGYRNEECMTTPS